MLEKLPPAIVTFHSVSRRAVASRLPHT